MSAVTVPAENGGAASPETCLVFRISGLTAALDVDRVLEVVDPAPLTPVPRMPAFLLGVMNLRGNVVTVVDLGVKMGLGPARPGPDACVVLVEVPMGGESARLGIRADAVRQVVSLAPEAIRPPPRIGLRIRSELVRGVVDRDGEFLLLLDIGRALADLGADVGGEEVAAPPEADGFRPILDMDRS